MTSESAQLDMTDEFLVSLRRTFVEEAAEFLEACEEALMSLESPERRTEALADIFRAYHSVKGSASAIGCDDLAAFAHKAEDCLAVYRKNPEQMTAQAAQILLKANDAIRVRLATILANPQRDGAWQTADIAEALLCLIAGDAAPQELRAEPPEVQKMSTMAKATSPALKIDASRVDAVMDMVGELVVIKSQITEGLSGSHLDARIRTLIAQLDKNVRELHERTLAMRMISLRPTFLKLQRAVKDVSVKLGKAIDFEVQGEDTEIDRVTVERLADPLLHLCRNAVDHGIETPDKRQKTDKPRAGKISLKAYRKGETVLIEIRDDGRGVDREAVIKKAVERQLLGPEVDPASVSEREAYDFLFHPGFSTAEKVTDVSGRGVGLDVVKSNIAAINGTIEVESQAGRGSLFRLCLPLTTAITDGIVVTVGDKPFILPLDVVLGFFEARPDDLRVIDTDSRLVKIKGLHYPFVRLGDYVGVTQQEGGLIVLIETMGRQLALQVDRVLGKTQVVLKPIGTAVGSTDGLGGAAVMGDGKVALILDVAGLAAVTQQEHGRDLAIVQ